MGFGVAGHHRYALHGDLLTASHTRALHHKELSAVMPHFAQQS